MTTFLRSTNIELCRIASIVLVLLVHTAFYCFGWPKSVDEAVLPLVLLESFTIIGVNVFVFISGWFSIKFKPKTLFNLLFFCFFYFVVLSAINLLWGKGFVLRTLFFVSHSNWFIVDYLGLVLVSPILNKFVEHVDKQQFRLLLLGLFIYSFWFGFVPIPGVQKAEFGGGYSILSFCFIYLLARYLNLSGGGKWLTNNGFVVYILLSLLIAAGEYAALYFHIESMQSVWYNYNNPLIILSSVAFFFGFNKLRMPNSKVVNHIAKSCLGVLLFHNSYFVVRSIDPFLREYYSRVYDEYSGLLVVMLWVVGVVATFVCGVLLDQLRLFLYEKCIFIFAYKNKKL